MLAAIAEQSEEVSAIVDDLLVAARTDIGELTVADVPVDLRAQTVQVLETLDQSQSIALVGQIHCCFRYEYRRETPGRCGFDMTLIRDVSQGHLEAALLQLRTNAFVRHERSDLSFRFLQALENGLTSGSVCTYNNDWHGTKLTGRREFPSSVPVGYNPTTGIVLIHEPVCFWSPMRLLELSFHGHSRY